MSSWVRRCRCHSEAGPPRTARPGTRETLAGLATWALLATAAVAAPGDDPPLLYDASADAVVLRFSEHHGELAASSQLVLYGDGRVLVERPSGPGAVDRWERRLDAAGVQSLLGRLVSHGVADVDARRVRARMAQSDAARGRGRPLVYSSDGATIEFELKVVLTDDPQEPRAIDRKLRWHALRTDARRYPDVAEIQGLEAARREMDALMARPTPAEAAP